MFQRIGLAWFLSLCASAVAAHEPILLDARRATPGLRIELLEIPSAKTSVSERIKYRVHTIGFPSGVVFNVWTREFGHLFHELAPGFQVDDSGKLVSSEQSTADRRLDEVTFEPGPYPRGAIWEVALVSADQTLTAFAKVIPNPIIARDGSCSLSLELVSQRGDRFLATGAGFAPGDGVVAESRYSGRVIQKRQRTSAEGRLPPDVIFHGAVGADRYARYVVKGRTCEVAVDYEWGEPALIRR